MSYLDPQGTMEKATESEFCTRWHRHNRAHQTRTRKIAPAVKGGLSSKRCLENTVVAQAAFRLPA
jgi:hypothetical protein